MGGLPQPPCGRRRRCKFHDQLLQELPWSSLAAAAPLAGFIIDVTIKCTATYSRCAIEWG